MTPGISFAKLIDCYGRVEIPRIQRDYAQGRDEQHIVRDEFLVALQVALATYPEGRLNLDFIYGSLGKNESFQPLDGQQRLTTLFLLHWYLAWVDGRGEDFQERFVHTNNPQTGRSRFGYDVRPDSREFMDELVKFRPVCAAENCVDLKSMITDQPWYFRRWNLDPTIRSALAMLEAMHEKFSSTNGYYDLLIDFESPAITFQLLDLEEFSLSDDLYIKMNARGKALTDFETFKARFEQHLDKEFADLRPAICDGKAISEFFAERMDNRWLDFLWDVRDKRTASFDDAAMNLIRVLILVTRGDLSSKPDGETKLEKDIVDLRSLAVQSGYRWFHDQGWLDQATVVALVTLLERWSAGPNASFRSYLPDTRFFNEKGIFEKICREPFNLSYQDLVMLAGYVQYLAGADGDIDVTALNDWMRIVFNLATNTDYDRPSGLLRSLAGLRSAADAMGDIILHLATPRGDIRGFFNHVVSEERVKAHLIKLGEGWPERIYEAESHFYFRGQIGFLLRFCGMDLNDVDATIARLDLATARELQAQFDHYFVCATRMIEALHKDSREMGRLWERALLVTGDYLLTVGWNKSLLVTASSEPSSWKRLLRDAGSRAERDRLTQSGRTEGEGLILKKLWNQLDDPASFEQRLKMIVDRDQDVEPWRRAILDTPGVYSYSEKGRLLRVVSEREIYLLKKRQLNGTHAELFTFCLSESLKKSGALVTLKVDHKEESSTATKPSLILDGRIGGFEAEFRLSLDPETGQYEFVLVSGNDQSPALMASLEKEGFALVDGRWTKVVTRQDMKSAVLSLDNALSQI